jgi:DNA (cytosine-5)-methyltransferase 1
MKILNLYAGIGGNRKLWQNVEVTAIENNPGIAAIYQDFFPNDNVIVGDAHDYLLNHFEEFEFIWTSPPCPTHSKARKMLAWKTNDEGEKWLQNKPVYPDMKLYAEILFLQGYFKGKYVVENVISWYDPLIKPQERGSHYFWANFAIAPIANKSREHDGEILELETRKDFDLSKYNNIDKRLLLRNCVEPEIGKIIFDSAFKTSTLLQFASNHSK